MTSRFTNELPLAYGKRDHGASDLIDSLRSSLPQADAGGSYNREKVKELASKLSIALETPGETVQRIAFLPIQTIVVRIANRLNIFEILVKSNGPRSGTELAKIVGVDHALLVRLLRYLVAIATIGEAGVDSYVATNITRSLSVPMLAAGVDHVCDIIAPAALALPDFLRRIKYQNPTDSAHCAFQDAFRTTRGPFEWYPTHPEHEDSFNMWMTGQREGRATWLTFFPFEEQLVRGFKGGIDDVMLVDVGGGIGHEVEAIKNKYPGIPGKFILQDSPNIIQKARLVPGMQAMVHDFFKPQPVKGSQVYYLRNILHDWPDEQSVLILSQIVAAMTPGYCMILINELVIPDQGANLVAAQFDICMMSLFAATERTESHWKKLVDKAGLKLEHIWKDTADAESVMKVVLK